MYKTCDIVTNNYKSISSSASFHAILKKREQTEIVKLVWDRLSGYVLWNGTSNTFNYEDRVYEFGLDPSHYGLFITNRNSRKKHEIDLWFIILGRKHFILHYMKNHLLISWLSYRVSISWNYTSRGSLLYLLSYLKTYYFRITSTALLKQKNESLKIRLNRTNLGTYLKVIKLWQSHVCSACYICKL